MCTILGATGAQLTRQELEAHFAATHTRGPDDQALVQVGSCWLGFQRLAIMDLSPRGMQPFSLEGDYVVCNGEIYGFRALRRSLEGKYPFHSDSDCEVLLPLYREYGRGMFSQLGSEFALVLYDHRKDALLAARDPLGIRPLYYGTDRFASAYQKGSFRCDVLTAWAMQNAGYPVDADYMKSALHLPQTRTCGAAALTGIVTGSATPRAPTPTGMRDSGDCSSPSPPRSKCRCSSTRAGSTTISAAP